MNRDDVDAAFAAGRIDRDYRNQLRGCLTAAAQLSRSEPMVQEIVERARVVQQAATPETNIDVLRSLESIPGAEHRPGTVGLFRAVHAGGMLNVADAAELEKVDTFQQLHALVRVETQPAMAAAIRAIWEPMQAWFDRQTLVFPRSERALTSPANADCVTDAGRELVALPLSTEFTKFFECETAAQALALLKQAVERMGRHFTATWFKSPAGQQAEFTTANRLLRHLRNVGLVEVLCNGFASGAADVLNPLHCLVLDVIDRNGSDVFTAELQQEMTRHHVDFSVFLATFSLPCLAVLEDVLRVPATAETTEFLAKWTKDRPDFGGKGFALDCEYDSRYFTVRYLPGETPVGVPLIDFDLDAFTAEEIEKLSSRIVRLGCPSLGIPHRILTRVLCEAYFAIILPLVVAERGNG